MPSVLVHELQCRISEFYILNDVFESVMKDYLDMPFGMPDEGIQRIYTDSSVLFGWILDRYEVVRNLKDSDVAESMAEDMAEVQTLCTKMHEGVIQMYQKCRDMMSCFDFMYLSDEYRESIIDGTLDGDSLKEKEVIITSNVLTLLGYISDTLQLEKRKPHVYHEFVLGVYNVYLGSLIDKMTTSNIKELNADTAYGRNEIEAILDSISGEWRSRGRTHGHAVKRSRCHAVTRSRA